MRALAALVLFASLLGACTTPLDLGGNRVDLMPIAGSRSSCFLHRSGRLQCLGAGGSGQLEVDPATLGSVCGTEPCRRDPITSPIPVVDAVALGEAFACFVVGGDVRCAGSNAYGTLGRATFDPDVHVQAMPTDLTATVREIVAGRHHVCARTAGGQVACWGVGNHGALGVDPAGLGTCGTTDATTATRLGLADATPIRCATSPAFVPGIDDAVGLRAGPFGTCVLRASGAIHCFGRNVDGSLGVGVTASPVVATPTAIAVSNAIDVALGERHGCAVDTLARTYCFGQNDLGQLGLGATSPQTCGATPCALVPARVTDLAAARSVHAGDEFSCVLLEDGHLRCFGSDAVGQVGDSAAGADDCGGTPCARSPHDVAFAGAFARVAAAGEHTLIIASDGTPLAFGGGAFHQNGSNTGSVAFPSQIYGIAP